MPKSALGFLLRRAGLGIFGVAGLSFGIGGAISEFGQTDRFLSEFEGIGLAVVCGGIGFIAKEAAERLAECDEQAELGDGGIQTSLELQARRDRIRTE